MAIPFFKSGTVWYLGKSIITPSQAYKLDVSEDETKVGIFSYLTRDYVITPRPATDYASNASGTPYADLTALIAGVSDFFLKASGDGGASTISLNTFPIGTGTGIIDSGLIWSVANNRYEFDAEMYAPTVSSDNNTLFMGGMGISNGVEFLNLRNEPFNINGVLVPHTYDATGSLNNFYPKYKAEAEQLAPYGNTETSPTRTVTGIVPVATDQVITRITKLTSTEVGTVNLSLRKDNALGEEFFNQDFDVVIGENVLDVSDSNAASYIAPQTIYFELSGVYLKGETVGLDFIPYFDYFIQEFDKIDYISQAEHDKVEVIGRPPITITGIDVTIDESNYKTYINRTIELASTDIGAQVIRLGTIANFPSEQIRFSFLNKRGGTEVCDILAAGGNAVAGQSYIRFYSGETREIEKPVSDTDWLIIGCGLIQGTGLIVPYSSLYVSAPIVLDVVAGTPLSPNTGISVRYGNFFTYNGSAQYTGDTPCILRISGTIGMLSDTPNIISKLYMGKNGVYDPSTLVERKIASSGDLGSATSFGSFHMNKNDYLDFYIDSSLDAELTISSGVFEIEWISGVG